MTTALLTASPKDFVSRSQ